MGLVSSFPVGIASCVNVVSAPAARRGTDTMLCNPRSLSSPFVFGSIFCILRQQGAAQTMGTVATACSNTA